MLKKAAQKGSPVRLRASREDLLPVPQCPLGLETGTWELGAVRLAVGASSTCVVGLQEYFVDSSEMDSSSCEKSVW